MSSEPISRLKLPEDLLNGIFIRSNSVKSLLRVKCACKCWYALIQNPGFIFNHFQNQKIHNKGRLLLHYYEGLDAKQHKYALFDDETLESDTYQDIDHLQMTRCLLIEGPINGLYCLFNGEDRIVLWNPTMMELKTLPLPHPHFLPDCTVYIGNTGFGIGKSSHDYKLVLIRSFQSGFDLNSRTYVTLYNLTTNTWRLLKRCNFEVVEYMAGEGCTSSFIDGSCHWWANHGVVIAFDMEEEMFRSVSGPDLFHSEPTGSLAIYNDKLALMYNYGNSVDIWVMLEEGVWIKQFSVTALPRLWVVGLWKNNGLFFTMDDFEMNEVNSNLQMVLYNFKTQKMRVMGPKGDPLRFQASVYYESLVSLRTEHNAKGISLNTIPDFLLGSENFPNWWGR